MGLIGDAAGVISPGEAVNFDASALESLLRAKELAKSGDFDVVKSADGLATINNAGDCLTNTTVTDTNGFLNDDVSPASARVAGSLGNLGAMFILAPKTGTHKVYVCIKIESGATTGVFVRVYVSRFGFQNITSQGVVPQPVVAGDVQERFHGQAFVGTARLNGCVTSGETEKYLHWVWHLRGTNNLQFSLIVDWVLDDTRNDADPYPYAVHVSGGDLLTQPTLCVIGSDALNAGCFVTAYGSNAITTCNGLGLGAGIVGTLAAQQLGKDTLGSKEGLIPLFYWRLPASPNGQANGGGYKGTSKYVKWQAEFHGFGEHGNQASPESRERFAANHVFLPWPKPSVECRR